MKVALIQLCAGANKNANIRKAIALTEEAIRRKAELICLPEVFTYRGRGGKDFILRHVAERIPGESIRPFQEIAKKARVPILAGSIYESTPSGKVYNTCLVIDSRGRLSARYRKIHLFDAAVGGKDFRESRIFSCGTTPAIVKIKGLTLGVAICFDLRFPEIFRRYRQQGCTVVAVPSSFTKVTGAAHWEALLRARAIENQIFILAPNQFGSDERGAQMHGHSMIIGPWGEVLARASGQREAIVYGTITQRQVLQVRNKMPLD